MCVDEDDVWKEKNQQNLFVLLNFVLMDGLMIDGQHHNLC